MSCCGGSCGCGSGCGCGQGCNLFPDLTETVATTTIIGFTPEKMCFHGFEIEMGAEGGGCKCGSGCSCDSCTCK